MRSIRRGTQKIWYCLYEGQESIPDEQGRDVGVYAPVFSDPVEIRASVSAASGYEDAQRFGIYGRFDKVVRIFDKNCPITETSVLFIDCEPSFDEDGFPQYEYVVTLVSKTLNVTEILVRKAAGDKSGYYES